MTGLLAGRRILVVEDEMLVLMNIEMMLADLGCSTIHTAASVAEAFAICAENNFDAAMLDVNLGGETSYPVAELLTRRGIPFAFATGYTISGHHAELQQKLVLRKPYSAERMATVFEQLLHQDTIN
jgi:CheY-like chemotaxis protein